MLFADSYFTVSRKAESLFKDRGSKFFAFCYPVKNESEIKQQLIFLKKEHPSATHHCYAWRLGADKLAHRINDDGEPSGTAGKPIFSQIQSNDLTDVLIVVVRYFGGTQLGVPGLINAYKSAAAEVIHSAGIAEEFIMFEYRIEFDMDDMSQVMRLVKEVEGTIISNTYDENNILIIQIKKSQSEKLHQRITDLYKVKLNFLRVR